MTGAAQQDPILSPLKRARGLGAAHHAVQHWVHQRITAIANIPLMLWLACSAVRLAGADYSAFTGWLAEPVNAILMILAVLSVYYHAALGLQVIAEDYVHDTFLKVAALVFIRLFFIAAGVACVFSVLKIALMV